MYGMDGMYVWNVCMYLRITQAASVAAASEFNLLAAGSHTPDLKVSQMPMHACMHHATQCCMAVC